MSCEYPNWAGSTGPCGTCNGCLRNQAVALNATLSKYETALREIANPSSATIRRKPSRIAAEALATSEKAVEPLSLGKFEALWEAQIAWREFVSKRRETDPGFDQTFWWNPNEYATVIDALVGWHAKQQPPK